MTPAVAAPPPVVSEAVARACRVFRAVRLQGDPRVRQRPGAGGLLHATAPRVPGDGAIPLAFPFHDLVTRGSPRILHTASLEQATYVVAHDGPTSPVTWTRGGGSAETQRSES